MTSFERQLTPLFVDLPLAGSVTGGGLPRVPVGVAEGVPTRTTAGATY